jgi:uncharacterized protein (UPF0333 family)
MKAQSAVEYMMIIIIVLAMIIPLTAYVWQQNEIGSRVRQGRLAVDTIAAAADNIYAQGPGAKTEIGVVFPTGYDDTQSALANNTIHIRVMTPIGANDIIATTKANVTGTLPTTTGYKNIKLELVGDYVNITSS